MVGQDPRDGLNRTATPAVEPLANPSVPATLPARQINFTAWAIAAIAGASIWVLIFKLL